MEKNITLSLEPAQGLNPEFIRNELAAFAKWPADSHFRILKRSLDARGRNIHVHLNVLLSDTPTRYPEFATNFPPLGDEEVHIAGAGPAGLFAALHCLELGMKPILWERGKPVRERRRDLAKITREKIVDPESNYCFGEGGAGTYSDGKLYTRSGKRVDIERILSIFVKFGAEADILFDAHPHIGTNKLPGIIERIRECIIAHGGEIHFESKITNLFETNGRLSGLEINNSTHHKAQFLILATGHSARDIFQLFADKNWPLEPKPFALGVRVEHSQELINKTQYKSHWENPWLPPAAYSLVKTIGERGVFSFCMCPGGIIAPAATAPGEIVVNGWSPSKRNNPYANSGMVVSVGLADFKSFEKHGPLMGMAFQAHWEKITFEQNQSIEAPAQRIHDFLADRNSTSLSDCSYLPGIKPGKMTSVLPPQISSHLKQGLSHFGNAMPGYVKEGIMVGIESRTSSPVRIPRDKETCEYTGISGIYPAGEGPGYAGGIVSAALDGMRCAKAIANKLQSNP